MGAEGIVKKFWLSGVALALLCAGSPALAADLPMPPPVYKAPPALAPVYNWTGFYLGAGSATGLFNADTSAQNVGGTLGSNTEGGRGWLGTAVVGFDYQLSDHVVLGVLGDFDLADLYGSFSDANQGVGGTMKEDYAWSAGARAGWLFTPDLLVYLSGGYTQAHFAGVNLTTFAGAPFGTLPANTYNGWFIGTGLETTFPFFGNGWFLRTDYRFAQYNGAALPELIGGAVNDAVRPSVQTGRVALIYKFNSAPGGGAGPSLSAMIADFLRPHQGPSPWTGFYLAAGGGYGMSNADTASSSAAGTPLTVTATEGGRGWFGTFNAGYDYQLTNGIVAGVFADVDLTNINGTFQDQLGNFLVGTIAGTMTESWAWASGVRAGLLFTPQILGYYDAGFTQARFSSVNLVGNTVGNLGVPTATLPANTYNGWFLGSGLETALPFAGGGWFARAEYRYSSYNTANIPETAVGGGIRDIVSIRPFVQTVRAALVYKFNWGEPLVAKY